MEILVIRQYIANHEETQVRADIAKLGRWANMGYFYD